MGLRRLITEFPGHLPAPSSDLVTIWYQSTVKTNKRAQTRWVASFNYGSYGPSSDADYHIVSNTRQENQTSPNSMGLRRLITEFLWPPSSSIIRHHIVSKYSSRQSNEPKLDGVASFNYGVPMATFQLHHQTLITI
ncbi:hypothetical protein EVAR_13110_1 [Eumeta japonica]|uniref:Uncharacterized protein n=1 Tax=Eumeta variegata TaxID=151549 RepID=A0A4C1U9P8_EUMVA|nr:hypothetical protein EVAR_13110_1 [Eumeta japonica]